VKYSHPRRARREHSSLEVTTEAGWQLLASRGGRRGVRAGWIHKRALGPPPPPSATVPLRGEFRWLESLASRSLSRLSLLFSLPCSVAARALSSLSLPAQPDRLTPFISRYLFTPTFYCHWIPTEQRAVRSPAAIHRHYKVIKSNLSNSLARVFLRNLAAGGPHAAADFHLRSVLIPRSN
jgi:hypothetical protein